MIEELRERFRDKFIDTARDRLNRGLAALGGDGDAATVRHELHALAGEASVLGLEAMCNMARDGEIAAKAWLEDSDGKARVQSARALRNLMFQLDAFAADEPSSAKAPDAPKHARGKRVLVIDDSEIIGEQLCDELDAEGIETRAAADAEAAIAAVTDFRPHVIASDVQIPGVEIASLCESLRAASPERVRILLVSGLEEPELKDTARTAGADAHVTKRSGLPAIVETIVAQLGVGDA